MEARQLRIELIKAIKPDDTAELRRLLSEPQHLQQLEENELRELLGKAAGNGNEGAVKLLLEAGAKTDVTAGSGPLRRVIGNQKNKTRNAIVNLLLDYGCEVDFKDVEGRTPLMEACIRGQDDVIQTLLARGADPNAQDRTGRAVLQRMAMDASKTIEWKAATLSLLLSRSHDLNARDVEGRSPLQWAASKGQLNLAGALLRAGSDLVHVNRTTDQGYAALHLAARHNEPAMIKLLLLSGAHLEDRSDGGWTPLLIAADAGNEPAIDALLTHGANVNARTSSGMTSLHWAAERGHLAAVERIVKVAHAHKNSKDGFDCTPLIRAAQHGHWDIVNLLRPHVLAGPASPVARKACERFRAGVVSFFPDGKSASGIKNNVTKHTVWQILYARDRRNPDKFAVPTAPDGPGLRKPLFRWIHLPANNVSWLEALLTKHFLEGNYRDLSGLKSILRLLGRQQHRGVEVHSRFMRPSCKRIWIGSKKPPEVASMTSRRSSHSVRGDAGATAHLASRHSAGPAPPPPPLASPTGVQEPEEEMMLLFMPYLHWETDSNRRSLTQSLKAPSGNTLSMEEPELSLVAKDVLLIHGYVGPSTDLHPRRTLDQFKHHSTSTDTQDADQVVYRYCLNNNQELKVFMVDQLWLLIMGDTLISCFPERWEQPRRDPLNLFDGVVEDINSTTRPPVRNVFELAAVITERCTGLFDRHQWANDEYLFAEMFELSIGLLTRKETALFGRFKNESVVAAHWLRAHGRSSALYEKQLVDAQIAYASAPSLDDVARGAETGREGKGEGEGEGDPDADEFVNKLLNIDEEAALLVECKDIEDELDILSSVLRQQRQVLSDMDATFRAFRGIEYTQRLDLYSRLTEQQRHVDGDVADLTRMARQARSVNDNLTQVLDLKQKHANAVEARYQRYQAQESARQGQTIMVFTIVTIIFLPLSFLATFFAINIVEFPHAPGSDSNQLPLSWVVKYVVGIGLGVSVPLIGLAFIVGDLKSWWVRRKQRRHQQRNQRERDRQRQEDLRPFESSDRSGDHTPERSSSGTVGWAKSVLRKRRGAPVVHAEEIGVPAVQQKPHKLSTQGANSAGGGDAVSSAAEKALRMRQLMPPPPRPPPGMPPRSRPGVTTADSADQVHGLRRTGTERTDKSVATEDLGRHSGLS